PVYDVLLKRLGASFMQYCLRPEIGKVEIAPFAYMRGRTFENAALHLQSVHPDFRLHSQLCESETLRQQYAVGGKEPVFINPQDA
ncbi:PhoH family protein, partial [Salmonella enterica subsp. enterica serovar Cerro]|nr:PhoH family protein [Salmonella enterica subsp. enterica serovar Cerro]